MVGIQGQGPLDPIEIYKALLAQQAVGGGVSWPSAPSLIPPVMGPPAPRVALPQPSAFAQTGGEALPQFVPQPQAPAGTNSTPAPDFLTQLMQSFQKYGQTWTSPEGVRNYPLPRNDTTQTPLENMASGIVNNTLGLPQNLLGGPVRAGIDTAQWLTTPQNEQKGAQPAPGPDNSGFTPGLPTAKINAVENGTGNPAARNPNSSAMGNGQFIKSTWMDFIKAVHPDLLKSQTEKQILQLRANPEMSSEATSWYAGQAVDALDKINMPATDTNLYLHHFLGPSGMTSVLQADPNAKASTFLPAKVISANKNVLAGKTAQDIIDWAAVKMGEYQGGPPTPRPQLQAPDLTAAKNWFDAAAPQGIDPQQLKNAQFAMLLGGISQGAGSADVTQPGGIGQMLANIGAGAGQGVSQGQNLAMKLGQDLKSQTSAYDISRGTFAQGAANDKAQIANTNADRAFNNTVDVKNYKLSQSTANALSSQPKILSSSANGLWIQQPGGQPTFMPTQTGMKPADVKALSSAFGVDSGVLLKMKYDLMFQNPDVNILTVQREIIHDLISEGQGQNVFGQAYTDAMKAAQEQLPANLPAASKQALLDKMVAGTLLAVSQRDKSYEWILAAAAGGNPGAIILMQYGKR